MITSKTSSFHNYITFYVVGIERSINNTIVRDCVAMPDEMAARWMTGVQLIRTYSPDGGNDRCPPSVETPVQFFAVCWPKFSSLNVTKLSAYAREWSQSQFTTPFSVWRCMGDAIRVGSGPPKILVGWATATTHLAPSIIGLYVQIFIYLFSGKLVKLVQPYVRF